MAAKMLDDQHANSNSTDTPELQPPCLQAVAGRRCTGSTLLTSARCRPALTLEPMR